jgi:hypothetical protein
MADICSIRHVRIPADVEERRIRSASASNSECGRPERQNGGKVGAACSLKVLVKTRELWNDALPGEPLSFSAVFVTLFALDRGRYVGQSDLGGNELFYHGPYRMDIGNSRFYGT